MDTSWSNFTGATLLGNFTEATAATVATVLGVPPQWGVSRYIMIHIYIYITSSERSQLRGGGGWAKLLALSRLVLSLHRARSARENFGNPLLETRIFVQGRAWTNMPGYGALGRRERVIMHKHGQVALLGGIHQALPGCNESCG